MLYKSKDSSLAAQFCHSSSVDELIGKLRNHYAWNDGESLPKWISASLDGFPHLQTSIQKLMQSLRSAPASFGDTKISRYDVLVNCMITDQIMQALKQFETNYRAAHAELDNEPSSNNAGPSYLRWLFASPRRQDGAKPSKKAAIPKLDNLKRSPLYQYLADTSFVPCEADREFMQAITLLYPYFIRNDDGLPMLPVACFIPLMYQHPYFMYTIEQKWNLYCNCHVNHSVTMQNILESLFRSYQDPKKFMKFQKEWLPLSQGALKRTTADLHELEIACSELFDIVKPRKPREADIENVDESLSDDKLERWYDFLAGKRYDVLFAAMQFFFGSALKQDLSLSLQLFRASIGSEDIEKHLNFTFKENSKASLELYAKGFGQLLQDLKISRQWDSLFKYLDQLFSRTKNLLSENDDSNRANRYAIVVDNLIQQQKRTERTVKRSPYPDDCHLLSAVYASMLDAVRILDKKPVAACKVSNGSDQPIDFREPFEYSAPYSINSPCSPDTRRFLIPIDYISAPCTRMMFSLIYCLWTDAIANGSATELDYEKCLGSYILALLANQALRSEYTLDNEQTRDTRLWLWAHKLLHTSAVEQREFRDPVAFPLDLSANEFPLLKNTMEYFWQMDELRILVQSSDMDFLSRLRYSQEEYENNPSDIPGKIINEGIRYWEQLQQGNAAEYKQFLHENMHVDLRNSV